jgi:carbonic anhydrase
MKQVIIIVLSLLLLNMSMVLSAGDNTPHKPSPTKVIQMLQAGNQRFYEGKSTHPHIDKERLKLAGEANQACCAYATVITCSDSRVPVELIFDAGVMDIFVVRVAGNVCNVDERGSIEYGLAHVHTPVLVVLGHTRCGAVTAVTHAVQGKVDFLERNIPPLIDSIKPAVYNAIEKHPGIGGDDIIPFAIEENVYQSIRDLFMHSPATRNLVIKEKVIVIGAIYDVGTGIIEWLPVGKSKEILEQVLKDPKRELWVKINPNHAPHAGTGVYAARALYNWEKRGHTCFEACCE